MDVLLPSRLTIELKRKPRTSSIGTVTYATHLRISILIKSLWKKGAETFGISLFFPKLLRPRIS